MSMTPDFLVVGTGLMGATVARMLTDAGHSVALVERRSRIGGNVHDYVHECGIRMHAHGPHYFRTSSDRVWQFVRRFAEFYPYEARVMSRIDGVLEGWPVRASFVSQRGFGPDDVSRDAMEPNFESAMLAKMPRPIFDLFVRGYTEKQWGVPTHTLDERLARRIPVRPDDDPRLTPLAKYQGLPTHGYTSMIAAMLDGIPVDLGVDYLANREHLKARRLTIFTGPIDEYFGFSLGRLKYRAQQRTTTYHPDIDWYQPVGQVNEPQHAGGAHIRTLEWKHLMPPGATSLVVGTLITRETAFTPETPDEYEYPFPDKVNGALYRQYRRLASNEPETLICGRLGEYRYYDMDQTIARAQRLVATILRHEQATIDPPPFPLR